MTKGTPTSSLKDIFSLAIIFLTNRFGPRFFGLANAYNKKWRKIAHQEAKNLEISKRVKEGVYIMLGGPNFETPAELLMLKNAAGVDAVGNIFLYIRSILKAFDYESMYTYVRTIYVPTSSFLFII